MKKIPKITLMLLAIIVLFLSISFAPNRVTEAPVQDSKELLQIQKKEESTSISIQETEVKPEPQPIVEPEPVIVPEDSFATILSFGDTLCHKSLFDAAYDKETGIYDFSSMFKYVEKYFQNSTISIGNCESPMAGSERGYTGYPTGQQYFTNILP